MRLQGEAREKVTDTQRATERGFPVGPGVWMHEGEEKKHCFDPKAHVQIATEDKKVGVEPEQVCTFRQTSTKTEQGQKIGLCLWEGDPQVSVP